MDVLRVQNAGSVAVRHLEGMIIILLKVVDRVDFSVSHIAH